MGCANSGAESITYNPQEIVAKKVTRKLSIEGELQEIMELMGEEKWVEAAEALRTYIEDHGDEEPNEIDGIGQNQMSLGYYQWFLHRHYKEGIQSGQYIGTPYDALSLCYLALKDDTNEIEKGIKWYRDMVDDYPDNFAILMGCANILNNKGIFEEAIDYYTKVNELKPQWVVPLQCMAYIYEYKRVLKTKSMEFVNKILAMNPKDRVGLFIKSRNQPTNEQKIEVLKEVTELHPKFGRAFNQIGIVYGGKLKEYKTAIEWYEKASQACPEYSSCYNNIGVNHELMKNYEEAIKWYFRGIEKDKEYKAPHANLIDVYKVLKYDDERIANLLKEYKVYPDFYYYYTGLAHYDNKSYDLSIKNYMKAYECADIINKKIFALHNSTGITYDDKRENKLALQYYQKAIDANPKYHSAYYNTAIIYKRQKNTDKAIEWYKKAIEVNPRYSYAYNNLANIYKNQSKYEEAIECYKKAVQHLSTYTLALVNMAVCYLLLGNNREAFNAFERGKECMPYDNNNLSQANKKFLNDNIEKFDKEGEEWRINGCVSPAQKEKLRNMIRSFEQSFKNAYNAKGRIIPTREKVLKKEITQILKLLKEDCFKLENVDLIFDLIKTLFASNEEYFHILPLIFIEHFYTHVLQDKKPVLEVEKNLMTITKKLSAITAGNLEEGKKKIRKVQFHMKNGLPPANNKVNLFKDAKYFSSYEEIYGQILHIHEKAKLSYPKFKELVNYVKKLSYGTLFGIGMKLPSDENYQFKVILRIFEKMFKKELTTERVESIIAKIDEELEKKQKENPGKMLETGDVLTNIMGTWTQEITEMVKKRKENKIQTKCQVSDLLRGKIMYDSVDHIKKAVLGVEEMCQRKNYEIIQMDNRLAKPQTRDVVFKIQIKEAVCQLQLAIKQDESQYHFTHSIYEIQRSPLGCIFGSYIFMSKGFEYPFLDNCKDIIQILKESKDPEESDVLEAAEYVKNALSPETTA